jgi:hypothetical protein
LNGFALKIIDEAATESEGEEGREIGVPRVGLRETGVEEASEEQPSRRKAVSVSNMNATFFRLHRTPPLVSAAAAVVIEMEGKVVYRRIGSRRRE